MAFVVPAASTSTVASGAPMSAAPARPRAVADVPLPGRAAEGSATFSKSATFTGTAVLAAAASLVSRASLRRTRRAQQQRRIARKQQADAARAELPRVDRSTTKTFRKELQKSDAYQRFGKSQMEQAMEQLKNVSGSNLMTQMRENGFRLTVGDVTFVLAESYGFCWGVERSVAMAYEARNFFPDKTIWGTNEIIHNPVVNQNLNDMGVSFVPKRADGSKDFSSVQEGDVVLLPAFGASVDEMALLKERHVQIVDTTCPWVSKVWNSVEKTKDKGHTVVIHGKYLHEETIATSSLAEKYLVVKDMAEAEYVAEYILGRGDREEFLAKFARAMPEGFDPDVDLERVGVANQTTMLKGETELVGKLLERVMIKKYGPQSVNEHYISFNTICDATQERQDAMYKMFNASYEPPTSRLYAELEGEQVGVELQSAKSAEQLRSRKKEDATRGAAQSSGAQAAQAQDRPDLCLVVGGYNSSNTTQLLKICESEGVPAFHIDCAERISRFGGEAANTVEHKPSATPPAQAMLDEGLEVAKGFLPEGPITIGLTSGASTPDNTVGECMQRILAIRRLKAQ